MVKNVNYYKRNGQAFKKEIRREITRTYRIEIEGGCGWREMWE